MTFSVFISAPQTMTQPPASPPPTSAVNGHVNGHGHSPPDLRHGCGMTLREYARDHYQLQHELRAGTVEQMLTAINAMEKWAGCAVYLHDLTDEFFNRWLVWYLERGRSRYTVKSKRGMLLCLWRAAWEAELAPHRPERIRNVNCPRLIPHAWTPEEISRLVAAAGKVRGYITNPPMAVGPLLRAFVMAAWDSCSRRGDLFKLKLSDIDSAGVARLVQGKTGWPVAWQFRPETVEAIRATYPPERQYIFPIGKHMVTHHWPKLLEIAGLSGSPKKIRKSRATQAELDTPGLGPTVLGHKPGSRVAYTHYVDPRLAMRPPPMPPAILATTTRGATP